MPREKSPPSQLSLFGTAPSPEAHDGERVLEAHHAQLRPIAARIPGTIRFGTSSWSFPGWRGIVWARAATEAQLSRDGLREYARHPLLRTVGIDRGYYSPIPRADLERYASQLPEGFRCCTKAPERITAPVHLGHGRGDAGTPNPDFLSPDAFWALMGNDFDAAFRDHAGPFMFEFPPVPRAHRLAPEAFVEALDRFLGALPRTFTYAVEIRERTHLTPAYARVLARHGVAHTYNYWTAMPLPHQQLEIVPVDNAPTAIVRLLMRPGTRYNDRKDAMAPFDRIIDVDEVMRRGVLEILKLVRDSGQTIFVLVNNKAEGSAPLTIRALAERLAEG